MNGNCPVPMIVSAFYGGSISRVVQDQRLEKTRRFIFTAIHDVENHRRQRKNGYLNAVHIEKEFRPPLEQPPPGPTPAFGLALASPPSPPHPPTPPPPPPPPPRRDPRDPRHPRRHRRPPHLRLPAPTPVDHRRHCPQRRLPPRQQPQNLRRVRRPQLRPLRRAPRAQLRQRALRRRRALAQRRTEPALAADHVPLRALPEEDLVHGHAQRPHVRRETGRIAHDDLRRHVRRRADHHRDGRRVGGVRR